ncbi:MAG TPA: anti-sigma factor [Rubrobacteraceae bacterium]|nr:anti-sigma factor [Rubrobacteraceae bacterium]
MDRARFEELMDSYVLGALTEEERLEFEEHLASYPERQSEVDELSATAGLLALYPEEREPPEDLRGRIMHVVEAESPERPQQAERRTVFGRLGELLSARSLALGAAALLVVGLFSWNMVLRSDVQELQSRVQEMQVSRDARMITLEGPGLEQGAHVELIVAGDDRAILMAENMPPVPEGKTCMIWVIDDAVPKPGGLFDPKPEAVAAVVEEPLGGADAVAITVEPEGGSPQPTTDPMLSAEL